MDLLFFPVMLLGVLGPAALFWRRHDLTEALALGALVSLGGWSALAFARFLLLLAPSSARTVGLLALAGSLTGATLAVTWLARRRPAPPAPGKSHVRTIAVLAGAVLMAVGLEAAVPHFGIANLYYDWWEHFDLARFYSSVGDLSRHYQDGYTVTSRTPVFNLLTSLGLTIFGDRFTVFQVGTAALAWLWVLPTLLLARRFLHDLALGLVAVLASSPLLLFATTYGWPKGLVAFFALLSLDRFLALREKPAHEAAPEAVQFGLSAGLTLMTHQGFAGYLLPLFLIVGWDCLRRRAAWRSLLQASLCAGLVALPWYAWAVAQYGLRGGLAGYPVPGYSSPSIWLLDHVVTLVSSVVPITALFGAYGDTPVQQLLIAYLRTSVGLMGAFFMLRVLAGSLRRAGPSRTEVGPLIGFAAAGIASTTLLLNGWSAGWASAESVFIPAMLALLLVALTRVPLTRPMLVVAALESIVILAVALAFLWSPVSKLEPNARLAGIERITFLGQQVGLLGVALLLLGMAAAAYGAFALPSKKEEPRAQWHEAPLAS